MEFKIRLGIFLALVAGTLAPSRADAGTIELSLGGSFNRSNYSETNYAWTRRMGFTVGYYFTELTEIEFAFQDSTDRTYIEGYEDTTFHDQVYSANWVQNFAGKQSFFQPYFKLGVGQLFRKASGSYALMAPPPSEIDSLTAIVGVGFRLHLTQAFSIRAEATTYLTGGAIGTWRDNYAFQYGVSWMF